MTNGLNRFAYNPVSAKITRSRFDRSQNIKTTFNAGDLIPFFVDEVLPGDTFSVDLSLLIRMSTPIHPVMDNAYLDVYAFFVPNRLVWDHWKEFMGENTEGPWASEVEYEVPQIKLSSNFKGSTYDHLGIPLFTDTSASGPFDYLHINALPLRGYALIWNEWFRDQNVFTPVVVNTGDSLVESIGKGNDVNWFNSDMHIVEQGAIYGTPLPVAKFHDYFTSALPMPQKGPAVTLPLLEGDATVYGNPGVPFYLTPENNGSAYTSMGQLSAGSDGDVKIDVSPSDTFFVPSKAQFQQYERESPFSLDLEAITAMSVNTLRQAFAMQRLFERDARGGTRYTEIIRSAFGVTSPDARQQRPEYIGGKRIPITMSQVLQTSETTETSPQGNTAAFSLTQDKDSYFTYSATEHGYIHIVCCVRTDQTYQQGVSKLWSRKRRYDFYDPIFANLGEQPIYNREIYFDPRADVISETETENDAVFGYQEAWAEYRYAPNRLSGAFRSTYAQPLDVWHYASHFTSLPTLSPQFLSETKDNIDRTLAVTSSLEDQFIADFYIKNICVRPMPMYSVPGLSEHY